MSLASRRTGGNFLRGNELGLVVAIVVVVGLTSLLDTAHSYAKSPDASLQDIVRQTVMLGVFALGSAVVIIAGGIDLSSGSVIAFGGTICATIMLVLDPEGSQNGNLQTWVLVVSIAGAIVTGLLIGSLHAWLINIVGLPPFVATLATLVGLRSLGRAIVENVTLQILHGRSTQIQIFDQRFRDMCNSVPLRTALFAILALLTWVMLSRTVLGRHLYALGGNEQAARLSGIRTDRLKWFAYCFSAVLSALAGVLFIGDQSVADPQTLGRGYELNAIAAAVVGGCSLQGGIGTIPGTVLGCLFLRVVIDGVAKIIKTGADVYEGLIVGIVVVIAVAVNQLRQTNRRGKEFFPGALGWVAIAILAMLAGVLAALMESLKIGGAVAVGALALLLLVKFLETRRATAARG